MKHESDIQRAHDTLLAFVHDGLRFPGVELPMKELHASLDVLCWVLEHTHNRTFEGNMNQLIALCEKHNVRFEKVDKPHTP